MLCTARQEVRESFREFLFSAANSFCFPREDVVCCLLLQFICFTYTIGCFAINLAQRLESLTAKHYFLNNEVTRTWGGSAEPCTASVSLFHVLPIGTKPASQTNADANFPVVEGFLKTATMQYPYDAFDLIPLFTTEQSKPPVHVLPTRSPLFNVMGVRVRLYSRVISVTADPGLHATSPFLNSLMHQQATTPIASEFYYASEYAIHANLQLVYSEDFSDEKDLNNLYPFYGYRNTKSDVIDEKKFALNLKHPWNPRNEMEYIIRCGAGEEEVGMLRDLLLGHGGVERGTEAHENGGGCCGEIVTRLVDSICHGADEHVRARVIARVSEACLQPPGMTDAELTSMILEQYNELQ
jgi:hypothetical protein